nr:MAG TPA: hypothetical protein [Caudoviricetes sp.]
MSSYIFLKTQPHLKSSFISIALMVYHPLS